VAHNSAREWADEMPELWVDGVVQWCDKSCRASVEAHRDDDLRGAGTTPAPSIELEDIRGGPCVAGLGIDSSLLV
jgi:hypothetical protein